MTRWQDEEQAISITHVGTLSPCHPVTLSIDSFDAAPSGAYTPRVMLHEQHTTISRKATARTWTVPWTLLGYIAIGLVALLPRVLDLGAFLTLDEASFWIRRSEAFLKALRSSKLCGEPRSRRTPA